MENDTSIDSTNIGTKKLKLPPVLPNTSLDGFQEYLSSLNAGVKDTTTIQDKNDFELKKASLSKDQSGIESLMEQLGQSGQMKEKLYQQEGVDKNKQELDRLTSELDAEQLANRRRIEKLQKLNPQGLFGGGLEQEVNRINSESLSKQADLAILQSAANRRYDTASAIADRKLQAELEPLKTKLDTLKFFYQENKADFTKAEERIYNEKIKSEERAFNKIEADKKSIRDILITTSTNQAPSSVLSAIQKAQTPEEAIALAGSYLMSPKEKLELQKLRGDIAVNAAELAASKQVIGGTTGDPVADIIAGSSRYGDKNLGETQLLKFQQATNSLSSLETLQGLLMQGKDGIKTTGPLQGRARNLITKLGGDANASAINATIQGLIPTVARGIFGEVGVLTDQDIANYRKTLPNLVSSEDQNKLVGIIMYDVLLRSLSTTLTSNAKNQVNVSNFLPDYQNAKQKVETLKSALGYIEATPIDPVASAKLEAGWNETGLANSINNKVTNTLNSWLNQ